MIFKNSKFQSKIYWLLKKSVTDIEMSAQSLFFILHQLVALITGLTD